MSDFKFGRLLPDGTDVEYRHPDVYEWQRTTGPARLRIAPDGRFVPLLLALAHCWRGPYWVLYVLTVPRGGAEAGRYQIPEPVGFTELQALLDEHRAFLEGDARHALWVASAAGEGTLVYDRHDVIFAYGTLEPYEDVLRAWGVRRGEVEIPVPHSHHYRAEFDAAEAKLLAACDWKHTPLREQDLD